jgi:hypothetical protein
MISSKIIINEAEIHIQHEQCVDPSWCQDKGILIKATGSDNNILSTIIFNDFLTVYVLWESCLSGISQEILYVPETGILFLGCGCVSARISTKESRLIGVEDVSLFWGLSRHKDYVLETGELECFLYSLSGKKISRADVDPPYEMEVTDKGIRFKSIVLGDTWLRYEGNV